MNVTRIGTYLGRDVLACAVRTSDDLCEQEAIFGAVTLFVARASCPEDELERCLRKLVEAAPVAIVLGGSAVSCFDRLLKLLAETPEPHIMTSSNARGLEEAIDLTLLATWPSEGRFDEWHRYVFVFVDSPGLMADARVIVRSLTGGAPQAL